MTKNTRETVTALKLKDCKLKKLCWIKSRRFNVKYQNDFVSLECVGTVVAAEGHVEELARLAKFPETGGNRRLEVVPPEKIVAMDSNTINKITARHNSLRRSPGFINDL